MKKHINRYFSVPVIDEPFIKNFTQQIYDEDMPDYKKQNHGKPIPSFLVSGKECATTSPYLESMERAEDEVAKRIKGGLIRNIIYCKEKLKRLEVAQEKFNKGGIKAFEVIL